MLTIILLAFNLSVLLILNLGRKLGKYVIKLVIGLYLLISITSLKSLFDLIVNGTQLTLNKIFYSTLVLYKLFEFNKIFYSYFISTLVVLYKLLKLVFFKLVELLHY